MRDAITASPSTAFKHIDFMGDKHHRASRRLERIPFADNLPVYPEEGAKNRRGGGVMARRLAGSVGADSMWASYRVNIMRRSGSE